MGEIFDIEFETITGETTSLKQLGGTEFLIVNVASACGFTPQYEGMQALYESKKADGLVVVGFPCNQFGAQEPGTHEEIQTFCETQFGVTFPMMAKIDVNGEGRHPLYAELCKVPDANGVEDIKWNFGKFIVRENGAVERFSHRDAPADLPL
jgi:glutathione peroxidase